MNWLRRQKASLVIGPRGLALAQGPIEGHMVWDELKDVRFRPPGGSFQPENATPRGIELRFAGATVIIPDIYDPPLHVIHERIMGYWK